MRFTDYYAEASCTAGRANFITGELPIRTGLTTEPDERFFPRRNQSAGLDTHRGRGGTDDGRFG